MRIELTDSDIIQICNTIPREIQLSVAKPLMTAFRDKEISEVQAIAIIERLRRTVLYELLANRNSETGKEEKL